MKESILHVFSSFDQWLFLALNGLHSPFLDSFMEAISGRFIWIPLYAVLLFLIIKKYQIKSLYIILAVAIMVTLSDQFSVHLFKNVFMRLRPCHNPSLEGLVHIVNGHCGGQYGFVSSHAANVFALAFFIGKILKDSKWFKGLMIWAFVVSYSRIYLGVHYPGDVFVGALLGMSLAFLLASVLKKFDEKYGLLNLTK